jgi:hypothetical protein
MIDWQRNKAILITGSETAIRAFLSRNSTAELCAVGYVLELGQPPPLAFYLCANTRRYFDRTMAKYRERWPDTPADNIRWNSGDYEFPAGLLDPRDEMGLPMDCRSRSPAQVGRAI